MILEDSLHLFSVLDFKNVQLQILQHYRFRENNFVTGEYSFDYILKNYAQ